VGLEVYDWKKGRAKRRGTWSRFVGDLVGYVVIVGFWAFGLSENRRVGDLWGFRELKTFRGEVSLEQWKLGIGNWLLRGYSWVG
jgi:hypothetical protein